MVLETDFFFAEADAEKLIPTLHAQCAGRAKHSSRRGEPYNLLRISSGKLY